MMRRVEDLVDARIVGACRRHEPPVYVKEASSAQLLGDEALPAHAYAVPATRALPVHTKEATWLSAALLATAHPGRRPGSLETAETWIRKAAARFDIAEEVGRILDTIPAAPAPPPDEAFAYIRDDGQRYLPIGTAEELERSADYLEKWAGAFRYDDRRGIAARILKRAQALSPARDASAWRPKLAALAGWGTTTGTRAARYARNYRDLSRKDAGHEDLDRLIDDVQQLKQAAVPPERLTKLAALLDAIRPSLPPEYQEVPEYGLFVVSPADLKTAATRLWESPTQAVFAKTAIEALPVSGLRPFLGELAEALAGPDQVYVDLEAWERAAADPKTAHLLERALEGVGIEPLARPAPPAPIQLARIHEVLSSAS